MIEKIESTDIKTPKQEIKEKETLDQILQSKISDPNTLQKAKPIFEEVEKKFQTSISDYIKLLDDFKIDYIINTEEDPIKYLIEDIEKINGITIIDVTKDKVVETKDKVENQNTLLEARTATNESYNKLDQKYKQSTTKNDQQQINTIKSSFTNETQAILTTQNLDVDTYAKFIFTQQKYEKELRQEGNTDFLDKLNEVNRLVKYTTSFSETTNPNKTDNIIENNKNLQTYINNSNDLQNISISFQLDDIFDFRKKIYTLTTNQPPIFYY